MFEAAEIANVPVTGGPSIRALQRGFGAVLLVLWGWSLGIDSIFWRDNENYSYGWVVFPLALFFLWRRVQSQPAGFWSEIGAMRAEGWRPTRWLLAAAGLLIFPLEVTRTEYHQSGVVLWAINLVTVGFTLASAYWLGGRRLLNWVFFPVLFFLTAVPWPARIEHPFVQQMMVSVSQVVSEALLWCGVPVRTDGAVLHLSNGPVGIVEACSGIRSLQSGLMVCLAVGELSMLSVVRRWVLVLLTVLLALCSNLVRTFTLCWIMEKSGEAAMHHRHDLVGNIAMYSLYALIWLIAQGLARRGSRDIWPEPGQGFALSKFANLHWDRIPDMRPLLVTGVLMLLVVHSWYAVLRMQTKPQLAPQFTDRTGAGGGMGLEKIPFDKLSWEQLGANSGESLRITNTLAPMGFAGAYHLFWKPSPASRTALHHRPDSCMPGQGWRQVGEVGAVEISISGQSLKWLVFQFEQPNTTPEMKMLQLWGVWRNGEPVRMNYASRLSELPEEYGWFPSARHMSGVELVSMFVPYRNGEPPLDIARQLLPEFFEFKPFLTGGLKPADLSHP